MEWVETTARTVEEAKDAALDQLGVDASDAEFEVLEEPRPGLFGRMRGEARVRARVAPRQQRPKQERRDRKRSGGDRSQGRSSRPKGDKADKAAAPAVAGDAEATPEATAEAPAPSSGRGGAGRGPRERGTQEQGQNQKAAPAKKAASATKGTKMEDVVTVEGQAEIIEEFLNGLLDAFDVDGEVSSNKVDEATIELNVEGDDLGLLIGPKGQTLVAVQDLARTYLQRKATGTYEGRVHIDISGYRQRRREALERFVGSIAEQVISSGVQKALEPMNAADRKVVHDAVNEIPGVRTLSEGEDPRRRVVIIPDAG